MSEEFELSTIKIPATVYVGFQGRRTEDEVPLGFMTPYDETKAGQKRRDTVDNWANGWGKKFNSVTIENKPMIGFKIGRSIRRSGGWGGSGASYIRVEDPRGFELEITIENLVMCMADNHIQDGEIVSECVWGRDGNRNILLPTHSEPYKASLATTDKLSKKLSLRDIKPGDKIQFVTGEIGTYMGTMYPLYVDRYTSNTEEQKVQTGAKRYVMRFEEGKKLKYEGFSKITFDKIIEVADAALDPLSIELEVNAAYAKDNESVVDNSGKSWRCRYAAWVTSDKYETIGMTHDEFTEKELKKTKYERNTIIVESNSGVQLVCSHYSNFRNNRTDPSHYYYLANDNSSGAYYHWNRKTVNTTGFIGEKAVIGAASVQSVGNQTHIEEADVKSFFLLKVELKSKLGETYSIHL